MAKKNKKVIPKAPPAGKRRYLPLPAIVALSIAAIVAAVFIYRSTTQSPAESVAKTLIGRWVRPDGGYVIEIRGVQPDGRLDARYFNPSPINVYRAEWRQDKAGLEVFVELRDVNYDGATYKLRYLSENDRLVGSYYQPLLQQTFDIFFVRMPQK